MTQGYTFRGPLLRTALIGRVFEIAAPMTGLFGLPLGAWIGVREDSFVIGLSTSATFLLVLVVILVITQRTHVTLDSASLTIRKARNHMGAVDARIALPDIHLVEHEGKNLLVHTDDRRLAIDLGSLSEDAFDATVEMMRGAGLCFATREGDAVDPVNTSLEVRFDWNDTGAKTGLVYLAWYDPGWWCVTDQNDYRLQRRLDGGFLLDADGRAVLEIRGGRAGLPGDPEAPDPEGIDDELDDDPDENTADRFTPCAVRQSLDYASNDTLVRVGATIFRFKDDGTTECNGKRIGQASCSHETVAWRLHLDAPELEALVVPAVLLMAHGYWSGQDWRYTNRAGLFPRYPRFDGLGDEDGVSGPARTSG